MNLIIFQFLYGEDGLDICKSQFLDKKRFPFLIENRDAILSGNKLDEAERLMNTDKAPKMWKKVKKSLIMQ